MELLKGLTMLWVTSDALTYPLKEATGVDLSLKRLGKYNCGALGDPKVLLFPPQPTCVEYPTWRPLICFIKTNLKFYTILRFETIPYTQTWGLKAREMYLPKPGGLKPEKRILS